MNLISRTSSSVRQRLWCQEKCQCHVICWVFIKIRLSWKVEYMTQGLWVSVLFSGVAEDVWHPTGLLPLAPHYSLYNHAKQLPNSSNGSTKASGNGTAFSFIYLGLFSHCSQEHDCNTLQIYPRQFNFCQAKQWYRWGLGRLGSAGSSLAHPQWGTHTAEPVPLAPSSRAESWLLCTRLYMPQSHHQLRCTHF